MKIRKHYTTITIDNNTHLYRSFLITDTWYIISCGVCVCVCVVCVCVFVCVFVCCVCVRRRSGVKVVLFLREIHV
jgi:hypothetical protein